MQYWYTSNIKKPRALKNRSLHTKITVVAHCSPRNANEEGAVITAKNVNIDSS